MVQDIYRLTPNNRKMCKQYFETPEETTERLKKTVDDMIAKMDKKAAIAFLSKLSMYDDDGNLIE